MAMVVEKQIPVGKYWQKSDYEAVKWEDEASKIKITLEECNAKPQSLEGGEIIHVQ